MFGGMVVPGEAEHDLIPILKLLDFGLARMHDFPTTYVFLQS